MLRLAVVPAADRNRRRRFLAALAAAFDVEVVADADHADAAIVFSGDAPAGLPAVVYAAPTERRPGCVQLDRATELDHRLRGRILRDASAVGPALAPVAGDVVLAVAAGRPVLVRRGDAYLAAVAPDELGPTESLRDRLVDGCFLGLLPIVELLRGLLAGERWILPQPRACFVLDDPNLHLPTYGHVDFRTLAAHADEHGYHVAVATVPVDQWLVSGRAAAVFRSASSLSLAVHGNSHLAGELARPLAAPARDALVAQSLRRIESLERRAQVHVARVMVAPHEQCSDAMADTLVRSEVEALCYGLGVRSVDRPLADWAPLDLRGGGLPVLPRRPLAADRAELALRAYLDQPLILGLHHGDLADGLDVLAAAAEELRALAAPAWSPLDDIARAGVALRREGETLRVRTYARRFTVDVPVGVTHVVVELPVTHARPDAELLDVRGESRAGARRLVCALRRRDALDHSAVPAPRASAWALQRRLLVEARDRLVVGRR